ncbi:DUF3291 domain-containing protein [Microlunatus speluncae]|uniref:DUF3291 domain-containing protein n=1 Tax=Microlunatus speluncae TaxID=2594267 RepID=UPI0012664AB6|nr:DUF3291 domain-containing protein [Microlunatus speluncae]
MTGHHLAELNVATLKFPLDDPRMIDFTDNLKPINALAERSAGYVWRLVDEVGLDATSLRPFGDNVIINLSVWADREALRDYVYRSGHLEFLRRRTDWFERPRDPMMVMWWIPAGHRPSLDEALARLRLLRENGPTPQAFTMREHHLPAGLEAPSGV